MASYSLQQAMFTPTDIEEESLIIDDRPYVGALLWQVKLRQFNEGVATSLTFDFGVVGPIALAEEIQAATHDIISATEANGWDNQINNEPVLRIGSEYLQRLIVLPLSDNITVDTSIYMQAGIGNLSSDLGAALIFRLGTSLGDTFAMVNSTASYSANPYTLISSQIFNWQVFLSFNGRYVFNDITLDGNTFKSSHSVDIIHEQGLFSVGFAMRWRSWGLLFSTLHGSQQFEEQRMTQTSRQPVLVIFIKYLCATKIRLLKEVKVKTQRVCW